MLRKIFDWISQIDVVEYHKLSHSSSPKTWVDVDVVWVRKKATHELWIRRASGGLTTALELTKNYEQHMTGAAHIFILQQYIALCDYVEAINEGRWKAGHFAEWLALDTVEASGGDTDD